MPTRSARSVDESAANLLHVTVNRISAQPQKDLLHVLTCRCHIVLRKILCRVAVFPQKQNAVAAAQQHRLIHTDTNVKHCVAHRLRHLFKHRCKAPERADRLSKSIAHTFLSAPYAQFYGRAAGFRTKVEKTGICPFYKRAFMPLKSAPEIRHDFSNMKSTLQGQKLYKVLSLWSKLFTLEVRFDTSCKSDSSAPRRARARARARWRTSYSLSHAPPLQRVHIQAPNSRQ